MLHCTTAMLEGTAVGQPNGRWNETKQKVKRDQTEGGTRLNRRRKKTNQKVEREKLWSDGRNVTHILESLRVEGRLL
jgi:hypothetical protein